VGTGHGSARSKKLKEAVEAIYWSAPTKEELEGTAYVVDDFEEPDVDVVDDNWDVILLYRMLASQWRTGFNGRESLDMNVFQHALDRKGVVGQDYERALWNLSVIESAALELFHKK
jgi:Phage related hypothetical protein (DUF1799)